MARGQSSDDHLETRVESRCGGCYRSMYLNATMQYNASTFGQHQQSYIVHMRCAALFAFSCCTPVIPTKLGGSRDVLDM